MVGFYDEMADMAWELLAPEHEGGLGHGIVQLKRVTTAPWPDEWTPGVETLATWPLSATAKRLHQRYENGVLIVQAGDMVTLAMPEVEPQITDKLVIDGAERAITNLTPIPPAGTSWFGRRGAPPRNRPLLKSNTPPVLARVKIASSLMVHSLVLMLKRLSPRERVEQLIPKTVVEWKARGRLRASSCA